MVDELFKWFCHNEANNIPVNGPTVKGGISEFALIVDMNLNASLYGFNCSQSDRIYHGNPWAEVLLQMLIWQEGSTSDLHHQRAGNDIFFLEYKTTLFYNAKPKSTSFEGRAGSGKKRVKRETFQLCCLAVSSKTFCPLGVSKFQKPRRLSRWQEIVQECICNWLLFTQQLVSLKGKWLAKTEMCFSYWINGLLRTTMILLWNM